jgi:hypothetical protein
MFPVIGNQEQELKILEMKMEKICTPDNGRYYVRAGGRLFLVEPIGTTKTNWGD